MLVLTRKVDETIVVQCPCGYRLKIGVASVANSRVQLTFTGNKAMEVARSELLEKVSLGLSPTPLLSRKELPSHAVEP